MTDQLPVHQVGRVVYRHTRKELECGRGEEVVRADAADGGVRVEAGHDGVEGRHRIDAS